jgi:hypothetical protein
MTRIRRWTTTLTAAALLALPAASFAQTTPPATAPQTTPPAAQPPATQPQTEQPTPQTGSSAQEAARAHLTAARNTLSQLTQLPAASQLQGETRSTVAELITNFNELITTQANWKESYEKVEANLATLLNAAPTSDPRPAGTPGAVGTTGSGLDPALRAKLVEFRAHLDRFEAAASPSTATSPSSSATTAPPATTTTAPPTEPPPTTPPTEPPPTTPPTTQPPPTTPPTPTNPARPDEPPTPDVDQREEIMNHIDAIEALLSAQATAQNSAQNTAGSTVGTTGTTGTAGTTRSTSGTEVRLTQAQVEQLRNHLAELRRLVAR